MAMDDSPLTQYLINSSMEQGHDEESDQGSTGWYALFRFSAEDVPILSNVVDSGTPLPHSAILSCDSQDFNDSALYYTEDELKTAWDEILGMTEYTENEE